MQISQTDSDKSRRVGVDEQFIKFRPSPNFKNMKKFLKSKIEICSVANAPPPKVEDQTFTATDKSNEEAKPAVYPPLPLDPPPPGSPPSLNIKLKKELEDIEYQTSPKEEASETMSQTEELITEFKNDHSEESPEKCPNPPICRDFIRGTCTRPGTCKYTHKFDISQLAGVYTFCRKYQNSVCTFPNCRYAHATVFEEQHFYRTGVLPAHALAHHKKVLQLPPPPPPPEESQVELPVDFSNPPPLQSNNESLMPIIKCISSANIEVRIEGNLGESPQMEDVPQSEWEEIEEFSSSPRDIDNESKCKNCEIMEFRLQYNKAKVENKLQSAESINSKIAQFDKKNQKLYTILMSVLKRKSGIKLNGLTNIGEDTLKTQLKQLNSIISARNRLFISSSFSSRGEDSNESLSNTNNNLSTLMAKLLQSSEDQTAASDTC